MRPNRLFAASAVVLLLAACGGPPPEPEPGLYAFVGPR
jgi:hypothetical protein